MSFLDVDGLSIRYWSSAKDQEVGAGKEKPSVVFFHGNAFSLDNWVSIGTLDLIARAGFSVYALDLPVGRSSQSSRVEKEKVQDYVPILEEIFAKLGIGDKSHPVVLVGPSMGGGFALAYSIAHPDLVSALVLISPALRTLDKASFSALEMPVLLLWGDKDDVFPVDDYGKNLKNQFPLAKLLILKGAGHAAYLDKPNEFHDLLLDFLGEIS